MKESVGCATQAMSPGSSMLCRPFRGSASFFRLPRADARGYLLNAPIGAVPGSPRFSDDLKDRICPANSDVVPRPFPHTTGHFHLLQGVHCYTSRFFEGALGWRHSPITRSPDLPITRSCQTLLCSPHKASWSHLRHSSLPERRSTLARSVRPCLWQDRPRGA
jgi:hypothetical protein